jgi:hypothetical protein
MSEFEDDYFKAIGKIAVEFGAIELFLDSFITFLLVRKISGLQGRRILARSLAVSGSFRPV